MTWNNGTPTAPGVYNASCYDDPDMRRAWSPETGWSSCWYFDASEENARRAAATPADRENLRGLKWRVPVVLAAAA